MTAQVDDIVTMKDWSGEWITVLVKTLGTSKAYGPTIEGIEMHAGVGDRFVALPASHLVEIVRVENFGHSKWFLTLPDGEEVRLRSKRAAKEFCEANGFVYSEV